MEDLLLKFLETNRVPPATLTVERTQTSKYQFYLTVRHFRRRLKRPPTFISYSRAQAAGTKAIIEEHGLWGEPRSASVSSPMMVNP